MSLSASASSRNSHSSHPSSSSSSSSLSSSRISGSSTVGTRILSGHRKQVNCLEWDRKGDRLATCGMDQSVRVWPIERMGSSTELTGHTGRVDQIHWFLNDDNLLLSGSSDHSVRIWDLRTNNQAAILSMHADNLHMSMSPCGTYAATSSSQDMLSLIELRMRRVFYSAKARYELNQHSWDRTGALFCIANGLGQVVLHSFTKTERPIEKLGLIQAHTGNCFCLQFDKSGRYFLSAAADATAVLWNVEDVIPLRSYAQCSSKIRAIGFSYDSKYIALGSEDDVVHVVDVGSGDRVARVATDSTSTVSLDWHPSKHILAFSGQHPSGNVMLWGTGV